MTLKHHETITVIDTTLTQVEALIDGDTELHGLTQDVADLIKLAEDGVFRAIIANSLVDPVFSEPDKTDTDFS
jgi:hypothetical protein